MTESSPKVVFTGHIYPICLHTRACLHTVARTLSKSCELRGVGGAAANKRKGKKEAEGRAKKETEGALSRQAVQSRLAMSPCHRHGNAGPADSFGLIGSCQGNDKINAARDGDIERWA